MAVGDTLRQKVMAAGIVARASPVGANVKRICACSGKTLWEERQTAAAAVMSTEQTPETTIFEINDDNFVKTAIKSNSKFDQLLRRKWTEAQAQGVFRYPVTEGSIKSRIIPGDLRFVAQLNEERHSLRRKPQAMASIRMPFNEDSFNFTKIKPEEKLMQVKCESGEEATLIINNSPIEFGNSLMVPSLESRLPQVLTKRAVKLALCLVAMSGHKSFRMGFNSLGAAASVNHLHWHLYYLDFELALESVPIKENNRLEDWPLPGFAFELQDLTLSAIDDLSQKVSDLATKCLDQELAHNLFITRNQSGNSLRLFFWVRRSEYGAKNDSTFNPALCEFSGQFICQTKQLFDSISEDFCVRTIAKCALDQNLINNLSF
jgi:GDP-D-glucose phosphorylase